jgi:O-antigen ligase
LVIRGNLNSRAVAGAFACLVLLTLPFAHTVALRNAALGIAWVTALFTWRSLSVPRIPLIWLFAVWGGLGLISLVWAVDASYSASELKSELLYPFLIFTLVFALSDFDWLERFRKTLLAATFLSCASALDWSLNREGASIGAWFAGPGMHSTFLVGVYPFALGFLVGPDARLRTRAVNALAMAAIFAGGAVTLNRMLWIVLALQTVLVLAMLWQRKPERDLRWRLALLVVACAAVFGGILYAVSSTRFGINPSAAGAVGETVEHDPRAQIWKYAVRRAAERPWLGAGFGRGALRKDFQSELGSPIHWHAHNLVLNYALSMGILGIVVILLVFGAVLRKLWQVWREGGPVAPYAAAGVAVVAGMLLKNMTDDLFVRNSVLLYFSIAGMILGAHARQSRA